MIPSMGEKIEKKAVNITFIDESLCKKTCSPKNILIFISVQIMILLIILTLFLSQTINVQCQSNVSADEQAIINNFQITPSSNFQVVSRQEWVAQAPVESAKVLKMPVPYVIIHHTETENCSTRPLCKLRVRFIQSFHIESRNWWDIGYNFLVGGNGEAYEGRGWTSQGAHLYGYNSKSIGIAFIGTFNTIKPPARQILVCKQLIQQGVEKGYLRKDYKVLAARQLQTIQSPGIVLYEDIKTWPHWAEKP